MKDHGIVDSGDTLKLGIGAMTAERWREFYHAMVAVGVYPAGVDVDQAYVTRIREPCRYRDKEINRGNPTSTQPGKSSVADQLLVRPLRCAVGVPSPLAARLISPKVGSTPERGEQLWRRELPAAPRSPLLRQAIGDKDFSYTHGIVSRHGVFLCRLQLDREPD